MLASKKPPTERISLSLPRLLPMAVLTRVTRSRPSPRRMQTISTKEDILKLSTLISHNSTGSLKLLLLLSPTILLQSHQKR